MEQTTILSIWSQLVPKILPYKLAVIDTISRTRSTVHWLKSISITTVVVLLASLCLHGQGRQSLVLQILATKQSLISLMINQLLVFTVLMELHSQIQSALSRGIWPVTVRLLAMSQLRMKIKVLMNRKNLLSTLMT